MLMINIKTIYSDYIDDDYSEGGYKSPYFAGGYEGIFSDLGYPGIDEPYELPATHGNANGDSRMLILEEGDERSFVIDEAIPSADTTTARIDIFLDPRNAFGDGHHPTTEICVHMLGQLLTGIPAGERHNMRMLDAGTGSGILSVLAAKMGISSIDAVDLSRDAVRSARTNAGLNRCEFRIACADIGTFVNADRYDIIMANMVTDVIVNNMGALADMLKDKGTIIVSGISSMSGERAMEAFSRHGFKMTDCIRWRGWMGFELRKP